MGRWADKVERYLVDFSSTEDGRPSAVSLLLVLQNHLGENLRNMDQEQDAGPHLSHAEVEHGADVDDEEEGADDRQGEHWKS